MTKENIVGPDQREAASPLAAMSEAEEREKAKAGLSDLLGQIGRTQAEADEARRLMNRLGDKARRAADGYGPDALDEAQTALKRAHAWVVEASLASFDKPHERGDSNREDSAVSGALNTLHSAAQRLGRPGENVARMEMKLVQLAEIFDARGEIFSEF
jgi:hypothetical protein